MILPLGNHFGKRIAWSLIYFLNYAYSAICPSLLFFGTHFIYYDLLSGELLHDFRQLYHPANFFELWTAHGLGTLSTDFFQHIQIDQLYEQIRPNCRWINPLVFGEFLVALSEHILSLCLDSPRFFTNQSFFLHKTKSFSDSLKKYVFGFCWVMI